jgi:hypothetical protein
MRDLHIVCEGQRHHKIAHVYNPKRRFIEIEKGKPFTKVPQDTIVARYRREETSATSYLTCKG